MYFDLVPGLRQSGIVYLFVPPHPFAQLLQELGIVVAILDVPRDLGDVGQPPQSVAAQGAPREECMCISFKVKQM